MHSAKVTAIPLIFCLLKCLRKGMNTVNIFGQSIRVFGQALSKTIPPNSPHTSRIRI